MRVKRLGLRRFSRLELSVAMERSDICILVGTVISAEGANYSMILLLIGVFRNRSSRRFGRVDQPVHVISRKSLQPLLANLVGGGRATF